MKFLISGSSGLVGSSLIPSLQKEHGQVSRLVRSESVKKKRDVLWIPAKNEIETENLEGFDCVVHLAGESIVSRWTSAKKKRIRDSRVGATKLLTRALSGLQAPPKTLICASALGFYGDRDEEILTEVSPGGSGFLAEICNEWEQAAIPAVHAGIRVVHLRFPVVLSTEGGALKKMLPPFRLGLGGVLGDGKQYMSWCTLDDVIQVIHHTIKDDEIRGPVNAGTQNPVTNRVFTETLGNVLHRPTLFNIPGFMLKTAMGEMAEEMLLASVRMHPARLLETGYKFRHAELDAALRHLLTEA